MSAVRRGILFAALAAMLFGSAYVATAIQLRAFSPIGGAMWRGALAWLVLAGGTALVASRPAAGTSTARGPEPAASAGHRGIADPSGRRLRLFTLGVVGGPVFIGAMNLAVAGIGATVTSFVAGLYAVLAALLATPLLDEPLEPTAIAGFVVALVGTVLLAELDPGGLSPGGLAAAAVAALAFALFLVLSRRWSRAWGLAPTSISLSNLAATAVGLAGLLTVSAPGSILPSTMRVDALVALAWLVVAAIGGQLLVVASVRLIDARTSSSFLLLNPITATILSAVLLGERLVPLQAVGGLLVLVGMALATSGPALLVAVRRVRAG